MNAARTWIVPVRAAFVYIYNGGLPVNFMLLVRLAYALFMSA